MCHINSRSFYELEDMISPKLWSENESVRLMHIALMEIAYMHQVYFACTLHPTAWLSNT